ncbi:MAG: serine hydrolase domain-containing protein [Hyphomonadaceae bacterium]
MPLHRHKTQAFVAVKILAAALITLLVSSCATPAAVRDDAAPVRAALAAELDAILEDTGFPGITAAVVLPNGEIITAASGLADVETNTPMNAESLMPAGSIGKTFVAATALALVEEGKLSLDAPIAQYLGERDWYRDIPNGDVITLRMLLNHSSGIDVDYISSPQILPLFVQTFGADGVAMSDLGFRYSDIVGAISNSEPDFHAGTGFAYSDANYILVGLLIEEVTGHAFYQEASTRFTERFALADTIPTPRASARFASGYEPDEETRLPGFPEKLTEDGRLYYDPALEWTGGGFASTAGDLAKWAYDLYGRRALPGDLVDEMIASRNRFVPAELGWGYGLAVQLSEDAFGLRLMHGGYIPGYSSYMEYQPARDMALAFQTNTRSGFSANKRIADRLWHAVLDASNSTAAGN